MASAFISMPAYLATLAGLPKFRQAQILLTHTQIRTHTNTWYKSVLLSVLFDSISIGHWFSYVYSYLFLYEQSHLCSYSCIGTNICIPTAQLSNFPTFQLSDLLLGLTFQLSNIPKLGPKKLETWNVGKLESWSIAMLESWMYTYMRTWNPMSILYGHTVLSVDSSSPASSFW